MKQGVQKQVRLCLHQVLVKMKEIIKCGIFVILLIVIMNGAFALGISPAKKTLDYSPEKDLNYSFRVFNDEELNLTVEIYVGGPLSDYIELEVETLEMGSVEGNKEIRYVLNVPNSLSSGKYESFIIVKDISPEEGMVGASIAVSSRIDLEVPEIVEEKTLDFSFLVLILLILAIIIVFARLKNVKSDLK